MRVLFQMRSGRATAMAVAKRTRISVQRPVGFRKKRLPLATRPSSTRDNSKKTQIRKKRICQSMEGCLNRCLMERYKLRSTKGENFQTSSLLGHSQRADPATTA